MLRVVVGDRLKAEKGEDKNTLPFVATGTIETERTTGKATVLVEAGEDGTVRLVTHPRHASKIGPHKVGSYRTGDVARLPLVEVSIEGDPKTSTVAELKAGLELVFADPIEITPDDVVAESTEQKVF